MICSGKKAKISWASSFKVTLMEEVEEEDEAERKGERVSGGLSRAGSEEIRGSRKKTKMPLLFSFVYF